MAESEFGGGGVMPSGLFPRPAGVELTPGQKLRLISTTGQDRDTNAPVDPNFMYGTSDLVPDLPVVPPNKPKLPTERERYKIRPSS